MNLKSIIKNIDKSESNSDWVCHRTIGENEFDIFNIDHDPKDRLKCYWYAKWLCTDSHVGHKIYFLDDKPVAVSVQLYRKSSEEFTWLSKATRLKVKKYLESLTNEEDNDIHSSYLTKEDLDEDISIGYTVEYGSNLLAKEVLHVESNETVKVVQTFCNHGKDDVKRWRLVEIEFPNGDKKEVELKDILIPYFVKS